MINFLIILLAMSSTVFGAFEVSSPRNVTLVSKLIERLDPIVNNGHAFSFTEVGSIALELDSNFNLENTPALFVHIIQHYASKEEE